MRVINRESLVIGGGQGPVERVLHRLVEHPSFREALADVLRDESGISPDKLNLSTVLERDHGTVLNSAKFLVELAVSELSIPVKVVMSLVDLNKLAEIFPNDVVSASLKRGISFVRGHKVTINLGKVLNPVEDSTIGHPNVISIRQSDTEPHSQ